MNWTVLCSGFTATVQCMFSSCYSIRYLSYSAAYFLLVFYHSCCVTFAESEPYCHSGMFVCLSVGHSATYSLPRLIDHNQIWSAGIYLSSDPCKPFWIPYLPYFWCQREKYAHILATANVTHRAVSLVTIVNVTHTHTQLFYGSVQQQKYMSQHNTN